MKNSKLCQIMLLSDSTFLFIRLVLGILLSFYSSLLQADPDQVSIQLKWQHSFQFAGYYAAIEKGFYRDAGLDVTLKPLDFSKDNVQQVIAGESEYGVSDSSLLIYHLKGESVILLNQIFQHSPLVFLSRRDSDIVSPYQMVGKSVAFNNNNLGDAALNTLLINTLGDLSKINAIDYDKSYFQQFIDGKIDVIFAYSTSEPYLLKEQGLDVNIINPQDYGIDFYGDNFFTTQKELSEHPQRVKKMIQATVKGWQYALQHPDEIIQLIQEKYDSSLSTAYLKYAARNSRKMIRPELIKLGSIDPNRYQRTAGEYLRLGFSKSSQIKKHFFYNQHHAVLELSTKEQNWLKKHPVIPIGIDGNWPPIDFINELGKHTGITADFLRLIGERLGVKFQPVDPGSFKDMLKQLKQGVLKVGASLSKSKQREQTLLFSDSYINTQRVIYTRDERNDINSITDLNNQTVAVEDGFFTMRQLQSQYPQIKLKPVKSTLDALRAVSFGKADAFIGNQAVADWLRKKELLTNLKVVGNAGLGNSTQNFAVSKKAPEWIPLIELINKALADIKPEEHNKILNRWLVGNSQPKTIKPTLELILNEAEKRWLSEHSVIRVSTEKDWPPFDFVDNDGQQQGITIDYWRLISQRLGIEVEFVTEGSWAERQQKLKQRELDAVGAIAQTVERKEFLNFSHPYLRAPTVVAGRINDNALALKEMEAGPIAVERGYTTVTMLRKQYPNLELMLTENTLQALEAVSAGKARAYVGQRPVISYLSRQHMISNLRIGDKSVFPAIDQRMAVRKDWPELISLMQKALDSISEDERRSIQQRWLSLSSFSEVSSLIQLSTEEKHWLSEHPVIRLGAEPNWPPYEFVDQSGQLQGISADIIDLIKQRLGIEFKVIIQSNWAETLENARKRKIDIVSSITRTTKREQYLSFSKAFLTPNIALYTRKDSSEISTLDDLKKRTLVIENQYFLHDQLIKKHPEINLLPVETTAEALKTLSYGKADAYIGNQGAANWIADINALTNLKITPITDLGEEPLSLAVRKDWPIFQGIINKTLASISEAEMSTLRRKWLGVSPTSRHIALSTEEQQWIYDHPVVKVANEQDWPPYNFVRNGEAQGYAIDLMRLIAQKSGLKLEFVNGFFWSELVEKAKVGEIDILPALWRTVEREKFFNFSRSYHKDKNVLVVRKGSSLSSLESLNGRILSVTRGSGFNVKIKQLYPDIRFLEVDDDNQALRALRMGQSDAFMGSLVVANYIIQDEAIPDLQIVDSITLAEQPEAGQLYMATSIENPILASILQKGLDAISVNEKRQLQNRWILEKSLHLSSPVTDEAKFGNWLWIVATLFIVLLSVLFIVAQRIPDAVLVRYFGSGGFRLPALLVMTIIVTLIGIAISYTLQQNRRETLSQIEDNLTVTLNSVVHQMENWVDQHFNFLLQLGQNSQLVEITNDLLKLSIDPEVLKSSSELAEVRHFFAQWEKKFGSSGFFVINPQMINIASARDSNIGIRNLIAEQRPELLKKAFAGEAVFVPPIVSDIPPDEAQTDMRCGRLCMSVFFAVPIRDSNDEIIAVLTQRLTSDSELSAILRFGRIGDSGESYAFDSHGLLASETRFREHLINADLLHSEQHEVGTIEVRDPGGNILEGYQVPAKVSHPLTHMAKSLIDMGRQGLGRNHSKLFINVKGYNDYRGVSVFGAGLWDFRLGMGITSEIDVDEGLAGFYRLQTSLLMIAGILLLLFISTIVFTLTLASRAGQAMGRSQEELETLVNKRTSKLRQSEEHLTIFRRFAETSNQGFGMAYLDTNIFYLNNTMCHILGVPDREAVYGSSVDSYYPAKIRKQLKEEIFPIVLEQGQWSGEMIIKRPDGKRVPTFEYFFLISDEQGTPLFIGDVISDISEHKKAAEVLAEAKEAAEAANRAKSEFLANMSHEIRTPMNAIIGFTELLNEQIAEPKLKSFVKTIQSAGRNLLALINDILDLSKIEAGKLQIEKAVCNPYELFSELSAIFSLKMQEKNLQFIMDIEPDIPQSLMLDAVRLRQVLFNLIGNAAKFTEQGYVRVHARTDNEDKIRSKLDLLIDVQDTGIGISEDYMPRIFQAFEQSSGQDVKKYGGTGLGLPISQRLIKLMEGDISLQSQLGSGSTFTIKLSNVAVSTVASEEQNKRSDSTQQIDFHPGSILIVDDITDNRELLLANFSDTALKIVEAVNGLEAVDLVKQQHEKQQQFDLILMDIRMPVMDGYQAAKEIKAFSTVPIVAITASVMSDQFEQYDNEIFDGFLRKPVLKANLFNELCKFLRFQEVTCSDKSTEQFELSETDLENLPLALEQLEKLTEQGKTAFETNKISSSKAFSEAVMDIAKQHPVSVISLYAEQLIYAIDSFDITAIKASLNDYPQLIKRLKPFNKTGEME